MSLIGRGQKADLDVLDLLPLKLIYSLLQLLGGACGIHGGSLEFAFSLMGGKMYTYIYTTYHKAHRTENNML